MREQINHGLERFDGAARTARPEKSAVAEKDVFDGLQAVKLQVCGSCLAYFRACSYPATRHYRPRRFFFHRKSAATWGLIPRLYQQARHTLLCFLLIESAHAVIRYEPTRRRQFLHLAMRRGRAHRQGSDGPQTVSSAVLDVA